MTDAPTDQNAPQGDAQPADAAENTEPAAEPAEEGEGGKERGNKEAAKYRTRLRETEAERDQMATLLETYRTREAQSLAETAGLASGADLLTSTTLAELLNDDGIVDPAKVQAATTALLATRPHWAKPPTDFGGGDRGEDVTASGKQDPFSRAAEALRGR